MANNRITQYSGKQTIYRPGLRMLFTCLVVLITAQTADAEDWPTYRHDTARSAVTTESLVLADLSPGWVYISPAPPQRAWTNGPQWDVWSYVGAVPMRDFDTVFFVTTVGEKVYFGSSVTNSVHCLDAATGQEDWFFRTNGAVRFPPSHYNGKLYFGSDDGYVYCTDSAAALQWKYSPVGETRLLVNNGKLITMWPVRSGTAVLDGKVYFSASLVPWKNSYLCSVDAITGSDSGAGLYSTSGGKTPVGAILASNTNIYLPQGRFYPQVFTRSTGSSAGTISGGGAGVYALLTTDGSSTGFVYGQGGFNSAQGYKLSANADRLASYPNGKCMVVGSNVSYVTTETFGVETTKGYRINTVTTLKAIDRSTAATLWSVTCNTRHFSLILADNILFAGGVDTVVAYDTTDGSELWSAPVEGYARGLAAAERRLFVSTDSGKIYMFGPGCIPADFNCDLSVDMLDFAVFAADYLKCTDPEIPADCQDLVP